MRITKRLAEEISRKLVQVKYDEISKLEEETREIASTLALEKIPKEVMEISKGKFKNYLQYQSHVNLIGSGFNHDWIHTKEEYPSIRNQAITIDVGDREIGKRLISLWNIIEKESAKVDLLRLDLTNTLLGLRTFDNIVKELPEAAEYLPAKQNTSLVINIESIRDRLK